MQAETDRLKRKLWLNVTKWSLKFAGCIAEGLTGADRLFLLEMYCLLTPCSLNVGSGFSGKLNILWLIVVL